EGGSMEPVHQTCRHDPDHPVVPALVPDDQSLLGASLRRERDRLAHHPFLDLAANGIVHLELRGESGGACRVARRQHVDGKARVGKTSPGVESRSEAESDRTYRRLIDGRDLHQSTQSWPGRTLEHAQPVGYEDPIFFPEGHNIGHRSKRYEIEIPTQVWQ